MASTPLVSIVLPTYQGAGFLQETLPALLDQRFDAGFEIVAIDSASSDGTLQLLRDAGARIFSIAQSEFGHGKTRNFGVRQAAGEIIVFLSQDAVPVGRDWLQNLVEAVSSPSVGAAFARQLARPEATPLESFFHQSFYSSRASRARARKGEALSVHQLFFSNVCSAARREVCLRFPFDETLIMSEDQVFSRDLLQAGFEVVYHPQAQVVHSHHYGLGALWKRNFDSGYSLRCFSGGSKAVQIGRAILFLSREVQFLARQKQFGWLLYLPLYEAVRFAAFLSGTQAERLPLRARRAWSLHSSFWKQEPSSGT